jgi:hypothetical protein
MTQNGSLFGCSKQDVERGSMPKFSTRCDVRKDRAKPTGPDTMGWGENLSDAQLQMGARNCLPLHKIRHVFDM